MTENNQKILLRSWNSFYITVLICSDVSLETDFFNDVFIFVNRVMVTMLYRKFTPRTFAIIAIVLTVLLCLYYASFTSDVPPNSIQAQNRGEIVQQPAKLRRPLHKYGMCPKLSPSEADIDTAQIYKKFDFQVSVFLLIPITPQNVKSMSVISTNSQKIIFKQVHIS